ncbi:Helicase-like [Geitlerinema sp. FC II]|nr:Helicase-like [Geitlerinema sp. FC II]
MWDSSLEIDRGDRLSGSSDFVMQKNTNLTPIPIFEIQSRNSVKLAELDIERSINVE